MVNQLFRQIGNFQKKAGVASAFGVVLYTDEHPMIRKVVEDDQLCEALNSLSGSRWVLFAARAKRRTQTYPKMKPGQIGMLYLMWQEPKENEKLLEALGMHSTENLPCLLVLFPDDDGQVYVHNIQLNGASRDSAYESLSRSVKAVTEAIEEVLPENIKNAEGVHAAVGLRLQTERQWTVVRRVLPFLVWAKRLLV